MTSNMRWITQSLFGTVSKSWTRSLGQSVFQATSMVTSVIESHSWVLDQRYSLASRTGSFPAVCP